MDAKVHEHHVCVDLLIDYIDILSSNNKKAKLTNKVIIGRQSLPTLKGRTIYARHFQCSGGDCLLLGVESTSIMQSLKI